MKKFYSTTIIILLFNALLIGQNRIYAPNLRAPLNGASNQNPSVVLDWDAVTGQSTNITYEVQLATQSDFSDAVTFPKTDVTALQMSELFFGQVYYWHVKAYDDQEPSDWSETWSFSVVSSVNVTSPSIDEEVFTTTLIEWDPIEGLSRYQLQMDTAYEWKNETGATEANINGSYAFDMNNIWVVGDAGTILHYNGTDWTLVDAGITEDLKAIDFVDESTGYAVGNAGTVLSYNGTDWTALDLGSTDDLMSVSFADANNGWAVGSNGALLHYDNGSWSVEASSDIDNISDVYTLSSSSAWICGDGKMVAHWDGSVWTGEVVGSRDHYSIWFTDENNGWVVSKSGKINHFNGTEWIEEKSGTNKDLFSVCFTGSNGYVVGKDGVMLNYIGSWQPVSSESTQSLQTIYVTADAGVIGGASGELVMNTGSGFNSPYLHTYNVNFDSADFEVSDLLFGTKIYFRMRAMHSLDTTMWTGGHSLITQAAPELDKPNNNLSDADLKITYKWKEYTGASEYTFQISPFGDFSDGYTVSSDSTSAEYMAKLFGQEYYWRVNAIHGEDVSDWSETRTLTTVNTVSLVSPSAGETDVNFCPSYEWEEIIGVPKYEIRIDKDQNFSQPTIGISTIPSFQCNNPLDRKTVYYWKVRAMTSIDTSNWSEVRSFTVEGYAGIKDEFSSEYVDLYPNPAKDNINLTINSFYNDAYGINIYDITGKVLYSDKVNCRIGENDCNIKLPDLQKGLYIVTITKQDLAVTKKLFVD